MRYSDTLPLSPQEVSHFGAWTAPVRVSLFSSDYPGIPSVLQADKELRDPPASVAGSKGVRLHHKIPPGISKHSTTQCGEHRDHPQAPGTGIAANGKQAQ